MKLHLTISILFLFITAGSSQISLQDVLDKAINSSPEYELKSLIHQQGSYEINNIEKNKLPQLGFSGQASYQSDVSFLDIELPGIEVSPPGKFQYKLQGEVRQLIYAGGVTNKLKEAANVFSKIEDAQNEVNLEMIREQVITLFFSILELTSALEIVDLKAGDINSQIDKMNVGVRNGVVLESEINVLKAAAIEIEKEKISILNSRKSMLNTLSILTSETYDDDDTFVLPENLENQAIVSGDLAFYKILNQQSKAIEIENNLNKMATLPKLAAFGNLGVGKPGLNFLDDKLSEYYILGLNMQLKLDKLYTRNNDRQIIQLQQEQLNARKLSHDLRMNSLISGYENDLDKYDLFLAKNILLLDLRTQIKEVAEVQLENGIINTDDYLIKLNEENRARINISISTIRSVMTQYLLQHITGNYDKTF